MGTAIAATVTLREIENPIALRHASCLGRADLKPTTRRGGVQAISPVVGVCERGGLKTARYAWTRTELSSVHEAISSGGGARHAPNACESLANEYRVLPFDRIGPTELTAEGLRWPRN